MVQVSADGLLLELNLEPLQAVTAERDGAGNTGSFNGSGSARFEKSADGYWLQRIPVDWRNPQSSDAGQTFPSCSGIGAPARSITRPTSVFRITDITLLEFRTGDLPG